MAIGPFTAMVIKAATAVALGLAALAAIAAFGAALLRIAAESGSARSSGDVSSRLRALDELVGRGLLAPGEYAARRSDLLAELHPRSPRTPV